MPITGLEEDFQQLALDILEDAAQKLLDDLVLDAPVDTGELRDSSYGPDIDEAGLTATIGFDAPQADWTDQGVAPHGIDGNPMTFFWENGPNGPGVYSFEHVDHPGQAGTGWFTEKVEEWDTYVEEAAR